jgi:hypothetical protein
MQQFFELDFVGPVFCERNCYWHFNVSVDLGTPIINNLLKYFIRIAFQLVPLSSEFFSLLSYGVAITVQIFMYCWFGNEVEIKVNRSHEKYQRSYLFNNYICSCFRVAIFLTPCLNANGQIFQKMSRRSCCFSR